MNYRLFLLLLPMLYGSCSEELIPEPDREERILGEITQLMDEQEICWNSGDLACFMEPYWQNDSLLFVGKKGLTFGWQNTLDNYKKSYPDTQSMGKLTFINKKISVLSPSSCYVIGQWNLERSMGDLSGHYTLLWIKKQAGWKIVSDHSS